jgi:hypothetical protein
MNNRSNAIPALNASRTNVRNANAAMNSAVNARTPNGAINSLNRATVESNSANINAQKATNAAMRDPTLANMNAARSANAYAAKANKIANVVKKLKNSILNYKMSQ